MPTRSEMVSETPSQKGTLGSTSEEGVSNLPNDDIGSKTIPP